jgi:hypothetical protein
MADFTWGGCSMPAGRGAGAHGEADDINGVETQVVHESYDVAGHR